MARASLPSGVTTLVARDAVGRVTAINHVGASPQGQRTSTPSSVATSGVSLKYAYDARGLVSRRELMSNGSRDVTTYSHDALGRLVGSWSAKDAASYGWDAASNLVFESHSNDTTTSQPCDGFFTTREVNAANQLTRAVRRTSWDIHQNVETSTFAYDRRGNRVSETTREGNPWWSQLLYQADFTYDGRDDVVTSVDTGANVWWTGDDRSARFVRDGMGRALTVVEDGVTSNRLYDGLDVVAEGGTQVVRDPFGGVQSEVTTRWDGWQQWGKWVTTKQDVVKDLLGSPVSVAVDGKVSADVQVFGDFGDVVDGAAWSSVVGFTGAVTTGAVATNAVSTGALSEFATRSYDAVSRVWLQDDSYRGMTTRASSMNRYAYVEGAPESFVDVLGFFRAAAAIQAQKLAALNAAFEAAFADLNRVVASQARLPGAWTVKQMMASYNMFHASDDPVVRAAMDQIAREAFYGVTQQKYQAKVQVAFQEQAAKAQAQAQARYAVAAAVQTATAVQANARAQAEAAAAAKAQDKNWWDKTLDAVGSVVTAQAGGSKCSSLAGAAYFVFSAGVSCQYEQAQYYEFDPVENLNIAWHGVVNFGGGAVNALSSMVNGIVDSTANLANVGCGFAWGYNLGLDCAWDVPDIPSIPIWGDYDQYRWSSYAGSVDALLATLLIGPKSAPKGAPKAAAQDTAALEPVAAKPVVPVKPAPTVSAPRGVPTGGVPASGAGAARSATIWDDLVATQATYPGSQLPKSFILKAGDTEVWVHANATEHMAEYLSSIASRGAAPAQVDIATQAQLASLQAAVAEAASGGLVLDELIVVGGWQLKFAQARVAGQAPALIHARYTG